MALEIDRFFILVFPFVICTTWAALLLWGENLKRLFWRFVVYSFMAGITQTLTYQIHLELIRFLMEILTGFLWAGLIFGRSWRWTAKIFLTSYLFGIITYTLAAALIVLQFQVPFSDLTTVDIAWLQIIMPLNILSIIIAWLINKTWLPGMDFFYELKEKSQQHPSMIIALVIQAILFAGVVAQIFLNNDSTSRHVNVVIFVGLFLLCGLGIFVLLQYMQITRREIIYTQDTAVENIMEMLNAVRGQRHDFLNHLQVIFGLSRMQDYGALEDYLTELVEDSSSYGELLSIDNPIISALVNAKIAQASARGIRIEPHIKSSLAPLAQNALDVGRVLGNLIDNALEAVQNNEVKWIGLEISELEGWLHCSVTNPSLHKPEDLKNIFSPGVSSKPDHSGLGLFIAKEIAAKLQGRIEVACSDESHLTFTLVIPLPEGKTKRGVHMPAAQFDYPG
ncbi:MAG: Spo0B domain-containing protein [Firmicutes bacterium]|nr:Spo0B domain-containing protein [Bacillota bacterium]